MAQGILENKFAKKNKKYYVDSAGTSGWHEGEQPDKEQDVANSSGREPIDQEVGDQHPERGRDNQKEGKDEERPEIEQPAAAEDCSVGSEDREAEEQHHPGGVDRRRDEPRVKKG